MPVLDPLSRAKLSSQLDSGSSLNKLLIEAAGLPPNVTAAVEAKDAEGGLGRQLTDAVGKPLGRALGTGLTALGAGERLGLRALAELSGADTNTPKNAREALGLDPEAGGRLAGAFDTTLGILLDPTTYLTLGAGAVAKTGLKAGGSKAAVRFAGQAIPGTGKLAEGVGAITAPLGRAIKAAPGIKHVREGFILHRATRDLGGAGAAAELAAGKARGAGFEQMIKGGAHATLSDIGLTAEEGAKVFAARENPALRALLTPNEEDAFNTISRLGSQSDDLLREAGIPERVIRDDYMRHSLTAEERDLQDLATDVFIGAPGIKRRKLEGTVAEINAKAGRNIFSEDPVAALAGQVHVAARIAAQHKTVMALVDNPNFLDRTGQSIVRVTPTAPGSDWITISHPLAETKIWAPADVAKNINRVQTWGPQDGPGREVLQAWDRATGWVKGATLLNPVTGPAFIARNVGSGIVAVAAENPAYLRQMGRAEKALAAIKKMDQGALSSGDDMLLGDVLLDAGLKDDNELVGWTIDALKHNVMVLDPRYAAELTQTKAKSLLGRITVPEKLSNVNATAENYTRMIAYFGARQEGKSAAQAAQVVRDVLFDYTKEGATAFENNVAKRLAFYTYARRVVPMVARQTARRPGVAAALQNTGLGLPDPEADFSNTPPWAIGLRHLNLPLIGEVAAGLDTPGRSVIETLGSVAKPGGTFNEPVPEVFFGPAPGLLGVVMGGGRPDRGFVENLARETVTPLDTALRITADIANPTKRKVALARILNPVGAKISPLETQDQQLGRQRAALRASAPKKPKQPKRPLSTKEIKALLAEK